VRRFFWSPGWRNFDPRSVGSLECRAWEMYYRRRWMAVLVAFVGLIRSAFGMSWPRTLAGAWYVLRANQRWAPSPDNDPDGARAYMARFYALLKRSEGAAFDPARASELEVEWWRAHRQHQRGGGRPEDERALCRALRALYAYVYDVDVEEVRLAAEQRALAMRHSDRWVEEGCDPRSPLIPEERAALVRSYAALLAAVHRSPPSRGLREVTSRC
jgi:hypothetical protein